MRQVGILEAKTHLSALVAGLEETGEPVTITRNGRPVAQLVQPPAKPPRPRLTGPELAERLRQLHEKYDDTEAEAREPLNLREAMGRRFD